MNDVTTTEITNGAPSSEAAVELELRSVSKSYGHVDAVRDVSLSVRRGEFLSILGPSGSGKTTLLQMIAGFTFPSSGSIVYRGVDITFMPAHRRNVGMVFQNYALFPHMTVEKNLAFPLQMRRMASEDIKKRIAEALDLVGLADYRARLPSQLSGGQQQRIAIARALVYRPALLLMDEPLGALDKYLRERLQVELKRIQRATGITIVYVTHDQQEALSLSDRIAVMAGSELKALGPSQEIYAKPDSRFIAEFVGDCNFFTGVPVTEPHGSYVEVSPGLRLPAPPTSPVSEGARRVTLCIRPESVHCNTVQNAWAVEATVAEILTLGDTVLYELHIDAGESLVPVSVKTLRSGQTQAFSRGDRLFIDWAPEESWLVEDA